MKKKILYAKEMRTLVLVGGILVLMAMAIIFTWSDNHTIDDRLFIIWISSIILWGHLSKPIYQYIINAYKIPISEIEHMYYVAMSIPNEYERYKALVEYHKRALRYYAYKSKQHHLGFHTIAECEEKLNHHERQINLLSAKISREEMNMNKN